VRTHRQEPWYEVTAWNQDGTSKRHVFRARDAAKAESIAINAHRQAVAVEVANMTGTVVRTWGDRSAARRSA
jgi:hypothetical protein